MAFLLNLQRRHSLAGAVRLSPGSPPDGTPSSGEVHVRLVDLRRAARAETRLRCFLSRDEIERVGRFHFDRDRSRFAVTRGWLRVILARCLDAVPEALEFSYGLRGKPTLAGAYRDAPLSFNVSHSGDYALIGVTTGRAIGVDVEQLRAMPDFESIATGYFSLAEIRALAAISEPDRLRAFFRCWARKEAFMKATGEGMSIALDSFSVSLDDDWATTIAMPVPPGEASREWTVRGLSLIPECETAVAIEESDARISAWLDPIAL